MERRSIVSWSRLVMSRSPVTQDLVRGEDPGINGHLIETARQETPQVAGPQPYWRPASLGLNGIVAVERAGRVVMRARRAVFVQAHAGVGLAGIVQGRH